MEESSIEVTAEPFGPTAGVDEESPEGVLDGWTGEILEAVAPAIFGGQVYEHQAVAKAARAGAIAVADVGADGMEDGLRAVDGTTAGTTLDGSEISKCGRRFGIRRDVEAGAKVREQVVIELPTSEHALEFGGRVTDHS